MPDVSRIVSRIFIKPAIYDIDIQPCFKASRSLYRRTLQPGAIVNAQKALSSDLRLFFFTQIAMEAGR